MTSDPDKRQNLHIHRDQRKCRDALQEFSDPQEQAVRLPINPQLLAFTDRCPYHAIKVIDNPLYGFQSHPEVDHHNLVARITRYPDRSLETDTTSHCILDNLQSTP